MADTPTPRQMLLQLLQGVPPPRPLFVPIVFSIGARIENLPIRDFAANQAKISSALKQIRGHIRSDGLACYFDPFLETEALGGVVDSTAHDDLPSISWPGNPPVGNVPSRLESPENAVRRAQMPVALEVVRRLAATTRDGSILMAAITGPLTLAAYLTQLAPATDLTYGDLPASALEVACSVATKFAAAFAEAGANLLIVHETLLSSLSPETCESWSTLLSPVFNIARFYEALPVLLLPNNLRTNSNWRLISQKRWDCVLAIPFSLAADLNVSPTSINPASLGITLGNEFFVSGDESLVKLTSLCSKLRPAIVTSSGDLPQDADVKRVSEIRDAVSQSRVAP